MSAGKTICRSVLKINHRSVYSDHMARRGSYAKGVAKREEILTTALDVIAREGYSGASVRQLADAVGLSQAGLLHYFDSKDELFVEVLRKRDETDLAVYGRDGDARFHDLIAIVRHNTDVPGLVQLYVNMSAAATDPAHAAHAFFQERSKIVRDEMARRLDAEKAAGHIADHIDIVQAARALVALLDGLQTQWLLDPTIDMAAHAETYLRTLGVRIAPDD